MEERNVFPQSIDHFVKFSPCMISFILLPILFTFAVYHPINFTVSDLI